MLKTAARMAEARSERGEELGMTSRQFGIIMDISACMTNSLKRLDRETFGIRDEDGEYVYFVASEAHDLVSIVACLVELLETDITRHMYSREYIDYLYSTFIYGSMREKDPRIKLDKIIGAPLSRLGKDCMADSLALLDLYLRAPNMRLREGAMAAVVNSDRIRDAMRAVWRDYHYLY
jgi:hypothetical protein